MKLLITGIHGFVGSNLVEALKDCCEIYGLDIVAPQKPGVVKTFSWDDLDALPEVDAVIHLAGKAHDTKNRADADVYFKINTDLTRKIYDRFLASGATKFLFFSSVKAAADTVEHSPLTEDIVPRPVGPYGESKIRAEEYIRSKWDVAGKRTYIFRPCMIHGPGNKGNLNLLYSVVSKGIPWPLGAYDNLRSFTAIGNLTFIIRRLLQADAPTGIYNIGDDTPLSTNTLITLICTVLGKKPRLWRVPRPLVNTMARCGNVLHLPLNTERLQKLTENYVVDNTKIKRALQIDALPVDPAEGIRHTIQSFCKK